MLWQTVRRLFNGKPAAQAYARTNAYKAVFDSREGQIVLADLAEHTGFYFSTHPNTSPEARAYQDGMRNVYSRILSVIRLTDDEQIALEKAVFDEASDN